MSRIRLEKYEEAYQMYLDGLSLQQIGNHFGITKQAVFDAFKIRKLQLRGPNFRPFQIYDGKKFSLRNTGYYSLTTDDRYLMHRYMWEKEIGPIPVGYDIHHLDEDKSHNEINNFECIPKGDHTILHNIKRGKKNAENRNRF